MEQVDQGMARFEGIGSAGLAEQVDQSVLMVEGNGSARIYSPRFAGSGKFTGPDIKTIGAWTGGRPKFGDLNNDNKLDFVIPSIGNPTQGPVRLEIFLNDGAGNFTYSQFPTRQHPRYF